VFGRRQTKTHGQLMRAELGEGIDHLRHAAVHAAGGMGAAVGPVATSARGAVSPRVRRVREITSHGLGSMTAAFVPLLAAARSGADTATKKAGKVKAKTTRRSSRSRKRLLFGLLTAGAAVGAAGALAARRRRNRWHEYDETGAEVTGADARSITERVTSAADRAGDKAAQWTGTAKESMRDWAHGAKDGAKSAADKVEDAGEDAADYGKTKAEQFSDKASSVSKNSR
jgi:hypothetical protein